MKKVRKNGLSGATAIVTPLIFFNVLSNPTLLSAVFVAIKSVLCYCIFLENIV